MHKSMPEFSGGAVGSSSAFRSDFHFGQNEKQFSFDQNENTSTFTENLKLFQWFTMFHSFIKDGLMTVFFKI
jgi:hypothetical protein